MRIALYLALVLSTVMALFTGMLAADEEGLVYRRFDVSALVEVHEHQRGARLGAAAPGEYDDPKAAKSPKPSRFAGGDEVLELVQQNVDPRTWDEVDGASMSARGRWLHVRNRPAVLEHVGEFLYKLTLEAQRRLLLSIEVHEGSSEGFPALSEGASLASSGSLSLPFGVERTLTSTSRVRFVADYEVEIAQGSNISNPIVISADEGLLGTFVATPSIDGKRVVVEALVQTANYGPARRLSMGVDEEYLPRPFRSDTRSSFGTIELPRYEHTQAHFTTVLPASRGTVSLPVAVGERMVDLRLKTRVRGDPNSSRLIDLGSLVREPMPVVFGKLLENDSEPERFAPRLRYLPKYRPGPCYRGSDEILDEVVSLVTPRYWEEAGEIGLLGTQRFNVRAGDGEVAAVRAFLRDIERQAVQPVVLEIRVWSQEGPVATGPVETFSRAGAQLVAAGRLPTIMGRKASLMAGSTANYVADYDVEVAQEARVGDPLIGQAFDGLVINLQPTLFPNERVVNLELEMLLARRVLEERPYESGAQFLGPIDKVRQDRRVVNTTVQIPSGGTYIIDLGIDPDDEKRRLTAEIHAKLP